MYGTLMSLILVTLVTAFYCWT